MCRVGVFSAELNDMSLNKKIAIFQYNRLKRIKLYYKNINIENIQI